jgi:hypothetical protein
VTSGHVRSVATKQCVSDRNCAFHSSLSDFFIEIVFRPENIQIVTLKMRAEKRPCLHVTCVYKCGQTVVKLHNNKSVRICSPVLEMTHADRETLSKPTRVFFGIFHYQTSKICRKSVLSNDGIKILSHEYFWL